MKLNGFIFGENMIFDTICYKLPQAQLDGSVTNMIFSVPGYK